MESQANMASIHEPPPVNLATTADPAADPTNEAPALPRRPSGPLAGFDAASWILITAFAGMAIAWETGSVSPWVGLLIGGGAAFLIAVGVLSRG